MKLKDMVYGSEFKREYLAHDYYKGYEFIVMNLGTHPTAYVRIHEGSELYKNEDKVYNDNKLNEAAHGGITYAQPGIYREDNSFDGEGYWIGWDYSHYGDYAGFLPALGGKRWTTEEIVDEVIDLIEILKEREK